MQEACAQILVTHNEICAPACFLWKWALEQQKWLGLALAWSFWPPSCDGTERFPPPSLTESLEGMFVWCAVWSCSKPRHFLWLSVSSAPVVRKEKAVRHFTGQTWLKSTGSVRLHVLWQKAWM